MRIRVVIAIKVAFTFIGAHPEYLTLFNNLNTHILQYTLYTVYILYRILPKDATGITTWSS